MCWHLTPICSCHISINLHYISPYNYTSDFAVFCSCPSHYTLYHHILLIIYVYIYIYHLYTVLAIYNGYIYVCMYIYIDIIIYYWQYIGYIYMTSTVYPIIPRPLSAYCQSEIQEPNMEVLYHRKPYFECISLYIP